MWNTAQIAVLPKFARLLPANLPALWYKSSPAGAASLAFADEPAKIHAMKLLLATAAFLIFSFLLGWGIILLMHGKPALLLGALAVYTLGFAKVGCASH